MSTQTTRERNVKKYLVDESQLGIEGEKIISRKKKRKIELCTGITLILVVIIIFVFVYFSFSLMLNYFVDLTKPNKIQEEKIEKVETLFNEINFINFFLFTNTNNPNKLLNFFNKNIFSNPTIYHSPPSFLLSNKRYSNLQNEETVETLKFFNDDIFPRLQYFKSERLLIEDYLSSIEFNSSINQTDQSIHHTKLLGNFHSFSFVFILFYLINSFYLIFNLFIYFYYFLFIFLFKSNL